MLAIEVVFLTGRYVATAHNTRTSGEWPPHPARLFSALVATHKAVREPDTDERRVLEWLEQLGPPAVTASGASRREVVTAFVPVNDVALTDVDAEAQRLGEAAGAVSSAEQSDDAKALKKAQADHAKAAASFAKAVTKATAVPAKSPHPSYGSRVLPETRIRQPRTFPSVTPESASVFYQWPDAEPTDAQRLALSALLCRVVRIGHSSSLVAARVVASAPAPTLVPAPTGSMTLRVVQAGQLRALERAFERHGEVEPRVLPAVDQPYASPDADAGAPAAASLFSSNWLIFRRAEGPMLSMPSAVGLASALRKTLISFAAEPVPEVISGHAPDGGPSKSAHLAVLPLPFVGHPNATGAVLGLAVVLPSAASAADRRAVFAAVDAWERVHRQEDEDTPRVSLLLGDSGVLQLERVEWGSMPATLRSQTWCEPSRVWHSVTPVALDQNPGQLHSRNGAERDAALAAAVRSVRTACIRVGLPEPVHVEILPAAPWAGAAKARVYPRFPIDKARAQRVLTHVRVEFEHPVCGPVLLGAGRFHGLGLFRPEVSR